MSDVTLTINNTSVTVPQGTMVLHAAREAGVEIPTLCHHDDLAGFGACRLCMVEIDLGGWTKMVASCLYPVADGIKVETESEKVVQHRKIILELLHARWPHVEPELVETYGVKTDRMERAETFCILCGLCVRHCAESKEANAMAFVGRGVERQVVVLPEVAEKVCPACGNGRMECLDACPTGVVFNEYATPVAGRPEAPTASPVRMLDDDNVEEVKKMVGD